MHKQILALASLLAGCSDGSPKTCINQATTTCGYSKVFGEVGEVAGSEYFSLTLRHPDFEKNAPNSGCVKEYPEPLPAPATAVCEYKKRDGSRPAMNLQTATSEGLINYVCIDETGTELIRYIQNQKTAKIIYEAEEKTVNCDIYTQVSEI